MKQPNFSCQFFWILGHNEGHASVLNWTTWAREVADQKLWPTAEQPTSRVGFLKVLRDSSCNQSFDTINCSCPIFRSRPSSRGDDRGHDSIQEKFFQPRFTQVPEDVVIEEGRFCRLDFKVMPTSPFPFHSLPIPFPLGVWGMERDLCSAFAL